MAVLRVMPSSGPSAAGNLIMNARMPDAALERHEAKLPEADLVEGVERLRCCHRRTVLERRHDESVCLLSLFTELSDRARETNYQIQDHAS